MANDAAPAGPACDPPTPGLLHESVIHDQDLFWRSFLECFGPRLAEWARANLLRVGIKDPHTADEIVQRIVAKLKAHWTYDPALGRLGAYLRRVVFNEVQQELRQRQRHPGDYGAAHDCGLRELEDSFDDCFRAVDTEWERQKRTRARAAVSQTRARFPPHEWEVFYLFYVERRQGPEVAREVNARFTLPRPLKQMQVYPIKNRVCQAFLEELARAGLDAGAADPETFFPILREALRAPPGRKE